MAKRFYIRPCKKFKVSHIIMMHNSIQSPVLFKVKMIKEIENIYNHSEKAFIKNVVINICLVPPDFFEKITDSIKKYFS